MAQLPRQGELVIVPQWLPRPLNIFRADLKGKWLATVNFRDADAGLVNLEGANLQRANLHGAQLQNAQLHGTELQTVEGLTEKQIRQARTDGKTKLPPYLKTSGSAEHDDAAPPREGTAQNE